MKAHWLQSAVQNAAGDPSRAGLTLQTDILGQVASETAIACAVRAPRPPSLLPPNATPLELALEAAMARSIPVPLRALWDVDICPNELLPWLEWSLHVDWPGSTPDEKREIIRAAADIHRKKGTPWAVRRAFAALRLESSIREWFEYGGSPYRFRVEIDITDREVNAALYATLTALIDEYKNVRSHLDGLRLIARTRAETHIGVTAISGETVEIRPLTAVFAAAPAAVPRIAIGVLSFCAVIVYPLH